MNLQALKNKYRVELATLYPISEIDTFFFWLLEEKLNFSKKDYFLRTDCFLEEAQIYYFEEALDQLREEKPIQYILGKSEFFGLTFEVNSYTLIPRPETEELVRWIIDDFQHKKQSELNMFEVGSGSGCIPISLATFFTKAKIKSIDISEEALCIARKNALTNNVNINFERQDFLALQKLDIQPDILISNPPYIKENEKHLMKKNVLSYEPPLALFVADDDPLIFYKQLFYLAKQYSIPNTYVEINEFLAEETQQLAEKYNPKLIELRSDIFGKSRMMKLCF